MKTYGFLILMILGLASCFEDEGNYKYADGEIITISKVEKEYARSFMEERLNITPEVVSTDPDARFKYLWTISEKSQLGDTLTCSAVLDTLVNWNPNKTYTLVLAVTNTHTGYTVYQEADLIVSTPYSRGWYVLKDDGQYTDVDLYTTDRKLGNIVQEVNGCNLKGTARKMSFISNQQIFDEEKNAYTGCKTLYLMTDQDIFGIDVSMAKVNMTFGNLFYESPEKCNPQMMFESMMNNYFIHDGKAHSIYNFSDNSGKFGMPVNLNGAYEYELSKHAYCGYYLWDLLVFDNKGSSFYKVTYYINSLVGVVDGRNTEMSCSDNNKTLLYLGNKDIDGGTTAYAVMQDKTDPSIRLISRLDLSESSSVSISNDTILAGQHAYNAEMFTMSQTEEVLYFVSGGKLWSRNVAGKRGGETEQFTIPAGEEATFLKYMKYKEEGIDFNYVVLGTRLNGNYKIRFFAKKSGGNIDPLPELVLPRHGEDATGNAKDVLYISPKVGGYSYMHTF